MDTKSKNQKLVLLFFLVFIISLIPISYLLIKDYFYIGISQGSETASHFNAEQIDLKKYPELSDKTFVETTLSELDFVDEIYKEASESKEADVEGAQTSATKKSTSTQNKKPNPTPIPKPPAPPSTCPQTTKNCIPCTLGSHWACRVKVDQTSGFRGVSCQSNNPGNIRPAAFKNTIITSNGGVAPCGKIATLNNSGSLMGEYMVFRTYSEGFNALKAYLKGVSKGQHGSYWECKRAEGCNLTEFFKHYAPGDPTYDDYVAGKIGVSVTTKLSWVVANKLTALAQAIQVHEGFFSY